MNGCLEFEAQLAARMCGKLDDAGTRAIEAHLVACAPCLEVARAVEASNLPDALLSIDGATGDDFTDLVVIAPDTYLRGSEIGRGGMGRIVRARDRRLGRPVAIKELLHSAMRDRFEREARLTARLSHPSIVNVHEAGRWPSGEPFYAMNYVAGRPLDRVIASCTGLRERLALLPSVIAVVDAIAYAHSERVLHRDLKPHNILCGEFGETVVIDWGLAKDLTEPEAPAHADDGAPYRAAAEDYTRAGVGTPQYMAPEQAAGEPPDERVDVYGLGATLYHVLAGHPPFAEAHDATELDRLRRAGARPLEELQPELPRELSTIVATAMASRPADRYASVADLAGELKRFQTGQLVSAHRYTLRELSGRWLRRHKAIVALAAAFTSVLVGAGVVAVRRIIQERQTAFHILGESKAAQGREALLAGAPRDALTLLAAALRNGVDTPELRWSLGDATRALGGPRSAFDLPADTEHTAVSPDGARLLVTRSDTRAALIDAATGAVVRDLPADGGGSVIAEFAPRGHGFLVAGCTGDDLETASRNPEAPPVCGMVLHVYRDRDADPGTPRLDLTHAGRIESASFTPDGGRVAVVATDGGYVWELAQPEKPIMKVPPVGGPVTRLAVSGDRAAVVFAGKRLELYDASSGELLAVATTTGGPCDARIAEMLFDARGRLYTGTIGGTVCLWDEDLRAPVSRQLKRRNHETVPSFDLELDAGGAWLLAGGAAIDPQLLRADTLEPGPILSGPHEMSQVAFARDVVLTGSSDGAIQVWDLRGEELGRYQADGAPGRLWLGPGVVVAVVGERVLHWDDARHLLPAGPSPADGSPSFLPDGRVLVVDAHDDSVQLWSAAGLEEALPADVPAHRVARLAANQRRVIVANDKGHVIEWDPRSGELAPVADVAWASHVQSEHGGTWLMRRFNPSPSNVIHADGRVEILPAGPRDRYLCADDRRMIEVFSDRIEARTVDDDVAGATQIRMPTKWAWVFDCAHDRVLARTLESTFLIDARDGRELARFDGNYSAGRLSPDGTSALLIDWGGGVRLVEVGGSTRFTLPYETTSRATAFAPDGRRVAVGGADGVVHVLAASTGTEVQRIQLAGAIRVVAFTPDGDELYVADDAAAWRADVRPDLRPTRQIVRAAAQPAPPPLHPAPPPATPSVTCPPGAVPLGATRAWWCVRLDGTADGPVRLFGRTGLLIADEQLEGGRRAGTWSAWDAAGRLAWRAEHRAGTLGWINVRLERFGPDGVAAKVEEPVIPPPEARN